MSAENDELFLIGMETGNDRIIQHGYHRFYPMFLSQYRDKTIKLLELGVHLPEPFNIWSKYFPNAELFGIESEDIDKEKIPNNCRIFKGSQEDANLLHKVADELPKNVDIIIDDGSHVPAHQLIAFEFLFMNCLRDGGIYIIEDIETSYWRHGMLYGYPIKCGMESDKSMVNRFKEVVDWGINKEFVCSENRKHPFNPRVMDNIGMVTFGQNCIIVIKKDFDYSPYENREYRFKHNVQ